jgi:hypothetical protein
VGGLVRNDEFGESRRFKILRERYVTFLYRGCKFHYVVA